MGNRQHDQTINVNVLLLYYVSKICHAHVLILYNLCKVFQTCKAFSFRGLTRARMLGHAQSGHTFTWAQRTRSTEVRWIIIFSTWPLSSADPITLEGTSPARHECIVDQRDNFALSKLLGGATLAFSQRGSGSELHRVIKSRLREAAVLLQKERVSTSQQILFKRWSGWSNLIDSNQIYSNIWCVQITSVSVGN